MLTIIMFMHTYILRGGLGAGAPPPQGMCGRKKYSKAPQPRPPTQITVPYMQKPMHYYCM